MTKKTSSTGALDVRLTLPGDIPGLLRRGSPVDPKWSSDGGVVLKIDGRVFVADSLGSAREITRVQAHELRLDLTDATGRQHALWWLAKTLADRGDLRPEWWQATWSDRHTSGTARWWAVWVGGMNYTFGDPEDFMQQCRGDEDVPALHDLWKERERLLPDGSRWVDAEALRRVCLHVAGREVGCG